MFVSMSALGVSLSLQELESIKAELCRFRLMLFQSLSASRLKFQFQREMQNSLP